MMKLVLLLFCVLQLWTVAAFQVGPSRSTKISLSKILMAEAESESVEAPVSGETPTAENKVSLEEKMASWEASEEEIKAASLGGVVPTPANRTDGFDIGLYIAFPFMIMGSLLFALFPFIMDKIDVSSVGPPPTV